MIDTETTRRSHDISCEAWCEMMMANPMLAFSLHRVVLDEAGQVVDLTFEDVNPRYETMLGGTRAQLVGKTLRQLNPAADLSMMSRYGAVAETGEPFAHTYHSKTFNRHLEVFTFRPMPGFIASLFQDVTKHVADEQAAHDNAERLSLIADNLEEFVWLRDGMRVEYISNSAERVLGVSSDEMNSIERLLQLVHEDDRPRLTEFFRTLTPGTGHHLEYRIRHPERGVRWLRTRTVPVAGSQNRRVGLTRDATEEKARELELERTKREAEAGSRAKGHFLAAMSHEIRTPLNAVIGLTHQLLADQPREDQRDSLETLRQSAESLLGLLNDVLDYSKIEAGKVELSPTPFEVAALVDAAVRVGKPRALENGNELTVQVAPDVPPVLLGDNLRLGQVLNNLVTNAVKFTHQGQVRVEVSLRGGPRPDGRVPLRFSVRDTGIGISAEQQRQLFQPFAQAESSTTRRFGGTGLGLVISRRLVELLGGTLTLESEPERGSTFSVDLELQPAERRSTSPVEVDLAQLAGRRVLLVDDNEINLRIARTLLERWGVAPTLARNGLEAVAFADELPFDLVVMDLHMPEMDGFDAAKVISARQPALSIIALTADAISDSRAQAEACGMTDFVTKPFAPDEFARTLCAVLRRRRANQAA